MFHKHTFLQSEVPEMLYCPCGETKDLHRHNWEKEEKILDSRSKAQIGLLLRCSICGELKNHEI